MLYKCVMSEDNVHTKHRKPSFDIILIIVTAYININGLQKSDVKFELFSDSHIVYVFQEMEYIWLALVTIRFRAPERFNIKAAHKQPSLLKPVSFSDYICKRIHQREASGWTGRCHSPI